MNVEIRHPVAVCLVESNGHQRITTIRCALLTLEEMDEVGVFLTNRGLDPEKCLFSASPEKTKAELIAQLTTDLARPFKPSRDRS